MAYCIAYYCLVVSETPEPEPMMTEYKVTFRHPKTRKPKVELVKAENTDAAMDRMWNKYGMIGSMIVVEYGKRAYPVKK